MRVQRQVVSVRVVGMSEPVGAAVVEQRWVQVGIAVVAVLAALVALVRTVVEVVDQCQVLWSIVLSH